MGTLDVGQIRYSVGPTTSALSDFQITFHGKQAHAGYPQEAIDPVVMTAEAVMELQTIRSRSLSPFDPGAISVTMVQTGVRTNIIPEMATLGGTIRVFDERVVAQVQQRMREIVESIAQGAGGSAQVEFVDYLPPVISDPALVKRSCPLLNVLSVPTMWRYGPRRWPPTISPILAELFLVFSFFLVLNNRGRSRA